MRIIVTILLLPVVVYLLVINVKLYYHPRFKAAEKGCVNLDLKDQLYTLKGEMRHGAAEEMQSVFPEGFVFMNAMYGLAICNYLNNSGGHLSPDIKELREDLKEVSQALHSADATRIFNEKLPLPYGAYYNGWVTYFEGKRLSVEDPALRDSLQVQQFQAACDSIAQAFLNSETPYLESYQLNTWPADNILCIAALRLHDELFFPKYDKLISVWLTRIKSLLDPNTDLIPHSVTMEGKTLEGARGSSQTLMLTLLPLIDSSFAKQQFALFQQHFVDNPFHLTAIREYPFGMDGDGDVDAGPVICGLGGAANIVGIAALYQNGHLEESIKLRNEVEGLSLPLRLSNEKFYFFGAMPMADAFLAWVNSFQSSPDDLTKTSSNWWLFHLLSMLLFGCFFLIWRYLK
ncbi:MAG: hypothetical protein GC192_17315 [Bacteroidetes bacterium]|nr:hypothetical protein [Bacteroidota bacterium]